MKLGKCLCSMRVVWFNEQLIGVVGLKAYEVYKGYTITNLSAPVQEDKLVKACVFYARCTSSNPMGGRSDTEGPLPFFV